MSQMNALFMELVAGRGYNSKNKDLDAASRRHGYEHGHEHGHGHSHDHDPEEHIGDTGMVETVWNIINLVIGGGVLSMPFVCKLAGWSGLIIVFFMSVFFCFTATVVGTVLNKLLTDLETADPPLPRESRDFAMLAQLAWGKWGVRVTAVFLIIENWSAAIVYMLFVGVNINIVSGLDNAVGTIASGVLSLIMVYMPLKLLSYVGMVGVLFASFSVLLLMTEGFLVHQEITHADLDVNGIGTAGGVVLFCFAGHACLPNLYWSMRHPREEYSGACVRAYSFICFFYCAAAATGYYYFGTLLTNPFTAVFQNPTHQLLAIVTILVKVQIAVPPSLLPPAIVIETLLELKRPVSKFISRCVIVVLSVFFALACSDVLTEVVALSGYLTTSYDSLIFPALIALKIKAYPSVFGSTRLGHGLLIVTAITGFLVAIFGTYASIIECMQG